MSTNPNGNQDSPRRSIYYWKCDRPAAFHGVLRQRSDAEDAEITGVLRGLLTDAFPGDLELSRAMGEGTHRTYLLKHGGSTYFVRVEDGPEGDGHLDVESQVMAAVAQTGVPVPRVFFSDGSRTKIPFSVQVIEFFECPDLNRAHREGRLPVCEIAGEIGKAIARWQAVPAQGFGPFQGISPDGTLLGYHAAYATYFRLHWERHLQILESNDFLSTQEAADLQQALDSHADLLELDRACLVHKDLAFWNILGTAEGIRSYIDWDDAIGGDPTDDLSLLACFHPAEVVTAAVRGYESVRPLPDRFISRFWLHLLRNMIVKAVIRVGAGYFNQTSSNFLMASGQDGGAFKKFTHDRLFTAYRGLQENRPLTDLL